MRRGLVGMLVLLSPATALAHRPAYNADAHAAQQDALHLDDIADSTVTYDEVNCDAPQLWLSFHADPNGELYVQLGIPRLPTLEDYRPSVAVLAPGLPSPDRRYPFRIPDGMGITTFDSAGMPDPPTFHEPLTQTTSWILVEKTLRMAGGDGFIVAWDPSNRSGRLWVAVGKREDFGPADTLKLPGWIEQTRRFHAVFPYAKQDTQPHDCAAGDNPHNGNAGGCGGGAAGVVVPLMLARRPRRRGRARSP